MSPESKFAGIFRNAQPPEPDLPSEVRLPGRIEKAPAPVRTPASVTKPLPGVPRPIGRPPGKRSDPEWKQFSILLKKDTQREAANLLRDRGEGSDLSGLMQKLLDSWVKRQKS
jgi:hypothetical protein